MAKRKILPSLPILALIALAPVATTRAANTAAFDRIPLEAAPDQGDFLYKVRPGDTMRSIAARYLFRPKDLSILLNRNHVRDANHLAVGSTIIIPRRLLMVVPARAVLAAFRGSVTIVPDRPVKIGTVIAEGARIQTGANSSVSFTLEDGSTVTLPSQSLIHLDRLRLVLATGELQQVFRLDDGKSQYAVSPSRGPASRFEVKTPVSVSAVRGTEFRVGVQSGGTQAVAEVLKDNVAVSAAGAQIQLPQGFGAQSRADSVGQPVKLLPPPQVALPIFHKPDGSLVFNITPLEKAVRYKMQIAADAKFQDVRDESESDQPSIVFPVSPVGSYFVRLTAVDANGLEGLPHIYPYIYKPH